VISWSSSTMHIAFRCSLAELTQGGAGGLSVLRTFRLLRILKLVRFLPALRYQLMVMLRTMDNVATFFALLVLFIFIFRQVRKEQDQLIWSAFDTHTYALELHYVFFSLTGVVFIFNWFSFSLIWIDTVEATHRRPNGMQDIASIVNDVSCTLHG